MGWIYWSVLFFFRFFYFIRRVLSRLLEVTNLRFANIYFYFSLARERVKPTVLIKEPHSVYILRLSDHLCVAYRMITAWVREFWWSRFLVLLAWAVQQGYAQHTRHEQCWALLPTMPRMLERSGRKPIEQTGIFGFCRWSSSAVSNENPT